MEKVLSTKLRERNKENAEKKKKVLKEKGASISSEYPFHVTLLLILHDSSCTYILNEHRDGTAVHSMSKWSNY